MNGDLAGCSCAGCLVVVGFLATAIFILGLVLGDAETAFGGTASFILVVLGYGLLFSVAALVEGFGRSLQDVTSTLPAHDRPPGRPPKRPYLRLLRVGPRIFTDPEFLVARWDARPRESLTTPAAESSGDAQANSLAQRRYDLTVLRRSTAARPGPELVTPCDHFPGVLCGDGVG
jgi:hypothetical protein